MRSSLQLLKSKSSRESSIFSIDVTLGVTSKAPTLVVSSIMTVGATLGSFLTCPTYFRVTRIGNPSSSSLDEVSAKSIISITDSSHEENTIIGYEVNNRIISRGFGILTSQINDIKNVTVFYHLKLKNEKISEVSTVSLQNSKRMLKSILVCIFLLHN